MRINLWTRTETIWTVGQAFWFYNSIHDVLVPEGFPTDFASIPRPVWPIWPPTGLHGWPAVVHDFLYVTHGLGDNLTRLQCDEIFRLGLIEAGASTFRQRVMYAAVRQFGGRAWDRYA